MLYFFDLTLFLLLTLCKVLCNESIFWVSLKSNQYFLVWGRWFENLYEALLRKKLNLEVFLASMKIHKFWNPYWTRFEATHDMYCTIWRIFPALNRDGQLDAEENWHRRNALTDILLRLTEQSLEWVTVFITDSIICKVIFLFNKSANKIITIGASKEGSDLIL